MSPLIRLAVLALLFAGCAASTRPPAGTKFPAYADGSEYYLPTNAGGMPRAQAATIGTTRYFQTNSRRICYGFEAPGTWEAGREVAVMYRLDGKGVIGVLLLSVADLGSGSVEDAIRTAAKRSAALYAKEAGGVAWTLTPYPQVPGAWRWTLPVEGTLSGRPGSAQIAPRWYLPVAGAWIAQFTIGVPPDVDSDTFVTGVLASLTTSREPRCYEADLRAFGIR
jgi:hypothetical protein